MSRVETPDEKLASWPKPPLKTVDVFDLQTDDSLIICAGFEDRALAVLNKAVKTSTSKFKVVSVEYLPLVAGNKIQDVKAICEANNLRLALCTYDRQDPANGAEVILDQASQGSKRLFIDLSGMSRLLIVQLVVAIRRRFGNFKNCFLCYAEALDYPPKENEFRAAITDSLDSSNEGIMFLSSGVFEVCITPELSSVAPPNQPVRLIVFPSFNSSQLAALRSVIQPSFFTIIHGKPPRDQYMWRLDAIRLLNNIDRLMDKDEVTVSTLDYRDTLSVLLEVYKNHRGAERIVVAPTGSKMQAVAVALLRAYMEDVQIVYPTPRSFTDPEAYTTGTRALYILSLDAFPDIFENDSEC